MPVMTEASKLLSHTKRVYLELQILANGNVNFAIDTDHIRASLRDIIAEMEGRTSQEVQEENEALSRV